MSARTAMLALLLVMLAVSRAAAQPDVVRFALVIGNNQAESRDTLALRYADDDAVATHQLLSEAGVDSVLLVRPDAESAELHAELAAQPAPRWSNFERAYQALFARMREARARGAKTEFLLFYSGHGDVERGEGYILLEDKRLTRTLLYALLSSSPAARNHVIIDACKSYFLAFGRGAGGTRSPYPQAFVGASVPAQLATTGFVLSTSSDRDSHEWERYQAGILSHELRSALRGGADADGDGSVTYGEVGAFLAVANQGIKNARFRPDFMVRPPEDDLRREVLSWSESQSVLQLADTSLGHVYVETASGERVLDVHAAVDTPLTLHVPPQRPLFLRTNEEANEYTITSNEPTRIAALMPTSPQIARRGALHLAFSHLFAAPFGSANVASFAQPSAALAAGPVVPDLVETPTWRGLRLAMGAIALGAAATGIALSTTALVKYRHADDASQVERASTNRSVQRLNVGSIVCYALAGVAGGSWAWLTWSESRFVAIELMADRSTRGARLRFSRTF